MLVTSSNTLQCEPSFHQGARIVRLKRQRLFRFFTRPALPRASKSAKLREELGRRAPLKADGTAKTKVGPARCRSKCPSTHFKPSFLEVKCHPVMF